MTLILSDAANIDDVKVQDALLKLDEVKLSLDCATQKCLQKLDRSHKGIEVENIKAGMLAFKARYSGPLVIEILIVKTLNDSKEEIAQLNEYLLKLQPTRIDIGTIDRPPAFDVKPVSYEKLLEISHLFDSSLPVYIASRKKADISASSYSDEEILETLSKRSGSRRRERLGRIAAQPRLPHQPSTHRSTGLTRCDWAWPDGFCGEPPATA